MISAADISHINYILDLSWKSIWNIDHDNIIIICGYWLSGQMMMIHWWRPNGWPHDNSNDYESNSQCGSETGDPDDEQDTLVLPYLKQKKYCLNWQNQTQIENDNNQKNSTKLNDQPSASLDNLDNSICRATNETNESAQVDNVFFYSFWETKKKEKENNTKNTGYKKSGQTLMWSVLKMYLKQQKDSILA